MNTPISSVAVCVLNKYHRPKPLYTELHHIVPQAWQRAWTPTHNLSGLWAPTTVPLCRTSHGNVHVLLVKMMKSYQAEGIFPAEPRSGSEAHVAWEGMYEFQVVGGDLSLLVNRGLFGEI